MMHMSLYWSADLGPVVVDWWRTSSVAVLVLSCMILAGIAIGSEFVSRRLMRECPPKARPLAYSLRCALSTFLMLALMSFNGWVIVSIIIGYVVGYCMFYIDEDEQDLACLC